MSNNQKTIQNQPHSLSLDNQSRAHITGVQEVISATEKGVLIKLATGSMQLAGEGMRVEKLSPEEKVVIIVGTIYEIKYGHAGAKTGFFKKLFR